MTTDRAALRSAIAASVCPKDCRDDYHEGWNDALQHVLSLLTAEPETIPKDVCPECYHQYDCGCRMFAEPERRPQEGQ
jgi:hypothetical protein